METGAGYQGNRDVEPANWASGRNGREHTPQNAVRAWGWAAGDQAREGPDFRPHSDAPAHPDMNATIGLMVGTIVHEVNNFLTGIMGAAQILEFTDSDVTRQGYYKNILRMSQRIHDLLKGIKDFSGGSALPHSLTDVRVPIEAAVSLVEGLLAPNGIRLEMDLQENLPPVKGNAGQLEQVFLNLFQNAIYAMGRGGVLTVSARMDGEGIVATVADTGSGIPGECLNRIFDVFFTTKPTGQGTGLGLAICKRILREHRGGIGVESQPGVGTRFTIRLPAAPNGRV